MSTNIDFYKFQKYIPPHLQKEVWEDNQNFMFEQHLYSEDLNNFITFITNTAVHYEEPEDRDINDFVHPDHATMSEEERGLVIQDIKFLWTLGLKLARKRNNSKVISCA